MDPVTQGMLGSSCAQSGARDSRLLAATVLGAAGGLAPDLDTLIHSPSDPLIFLEFHRQFTHALAFIPVGALLVTAAMSWWWRTRLDFARSYLFCLLGYASHGLLDACTSYGTQLLWPFSDARIAWSNVSVVDPLFSLPLLGLGALALKRGRALYARLGLAWVLCYLGLGVVQNHRALAAAAELAQARGHLPLRLEAKPALGSLLLWKSIYEHENRFYVDAVRTGLGTRVHAGESIAKLDLGATFPWLEPNSQQAVDVARFRRIADGFLARDERVPSRIIDLRYSMVPNEIDAFWAIELDPMARSTEHVRFLVTRERAPEQLLRLLAMLFDP